ncbi:MAG: acyl-CoA dehydrogenase family protein [Gammaproteobacteria bacterium]
MDFQWTPEDEAYRAELRQFLFQALGPDWKGYDHADLETYERESKKFCAGMAERGWLTQSWPREYGGQDASPWRAAILSEETWPRGEPRGPQYMNVNWIGPAIMKFGTPEQKAYHLNRISRGDVCWCQGFSEPGAGSDLAALRTQAVREGDHYVVNGEKIWTSHTGLAEWCFLLVRTDPAQKRAKGITCLLVPTNTPGFKINKVAGFMGEQAFANPVFTDMRVPVANRVGEENEGWEVVRYALAFERVGAAHHKSCEVRLNALAEIAHQEGRMDDPHIRAKFGQAWALTEAARILYYKVVDLRAHGSGPTTDSNMSRVAGTMAYRAVHELCLLLMGEEALVRGSVGDATRTMSFGIAAGTYEIQLDQIATQQLGMKRG